MDNSMTFFKFEEILVFQGLQQYSNKSARILTKEGIEHFYWEKFEEEIVELKNMVENSDDFITYENDRIGNLYVRKDINNKLRLSYFTSSEEDRNYYMDIGTNKQLYFYHNDILYLLLKTYLYEFTIVSPGEEVKPDNLKNNIDILNNL